MRRCAICNADFKVQHNLKGRKLCCSRACGFKYQAKIRAIAHQRKIDNGEIKSKNRYKALIGRLVRCKGCPRFIVRNNGSSNCCVDCYKDVSGTYLKKPRRSAVCRICFKVYMARGINGSEVCSQNCRRKLFRSTAIGKSYESKHNRIIKDRQRAAAHGVQFEVIHREDVFNADDWICQGCGSPVVKPTAAYRPDQATLDHIVPIELGGHHLRHNVETLCHRCNSIKGDAL